MVVQIKDEGCVLMEIVTKYHLNDTKADLTVPKGNVEVTIKKKYVDRPMFHMIGRHVMTQSDNYLFVGNPIDLIASVNKDGAFAISKLVHDNFLDMRPNIIYYDSSSLTQSEKNRLSRGYKELRAKDILRRIKRNHYMLNPEIFHVTEYMLTKHYDSYDDFIQEYKSIEG
jgi:hypothetical protein